jgi:lysophospholipase L1-like esterase
LREKYQRLNKALREYTDATPLTMFADVWTPMLDKSGKPLPVFLEDNLHMTAEGYRIWQKVLREYIPANIKD